MRSVIITRSVLLLAGVFAAEARDCERACKLFADNNKKYLVHDAKVACKKHNISPRPTTEDICLSTYRALTHSSCLNHCDEVHYHVEDACGAIAGTTWIPKHNAFRACKTGYKSAVQNVPKLVEAAIEKSDALAELFSGESGFVSMGSHTMKFDNAPKAAATPAKDAVGEAKAAEEATAEEELEEEEFVFPITIDDGSVQNLVVSSKDDVDAKVAAFCSTYMASEPGCVDQLLPIVKDRMI